MEQAGTTRPSLMVVDCVAGNSNKEYRRQPAVAESAVQTKMAIVQSLANTESNIHEVISLPEQPRAVAKMKYGIPSPMLVLAGRRPMPLLREIHKDLSGQLAVRVA